MIKSSVSLVGDVDALPIVSERILSINYPSATISTGEHQSPSNTITRTIRGILTPTSYDAKVHPQPTSTRQPLSSPLMNHHNSQKTINISSVRNPSLHLPGTRAAAAAAAVTKNSSKVTIFDNASYANFTDSQKREYKLSRLVEYGIHGCRTDKGLALPYEGVWDDGLFYSSSEYEELMRIRAAASPLTTVPLEVTSKSLPHPSVPTTVEGGSTGSNPNPILNLDPSRSTHSISKNEDKSLVSDTNDQHSRSFGLVSSFLIPVRSLYKLLDFSSSGASAGARAGLSVGPVIEVSNAVSNNPKIKQPIHASSSIYTGNPINVPTSILCTPKIQAELEQEPSLAAESIGAVPVLIDASGNRQLSSLKAFETLTASHIGGMGTGRGEASDPEYKDNAMVTLGANSNPEGGEGGRGQDIETYFSDIINMKNNDGDGDGDVCDKFMPDTGSAEESKSVVYGSKAITSIKGPSIKITPPAAATIGIKAVSSVPYEGHSSFKTSIITPSISSPLRVIGADISKLSDFSDMDGDEEACMSMDGAEVDKRGGFRQTVVSQDIRSKISSSNGYSSSKSSSHMQVLKGPIDPRLLSEKAPQPCSLFNEETLSSI